MPGRLSRPGVVRELEEEERQLGGTQRGLDLFVRDISHMRKNAMDAVEPGFRLFLDKGIRRTPAAYAWVSGDGAQRPAAATSRNADAQVALVDQADVGQDLSLLEA